MRVWLLVRWGLSSLFGAPCGSRARVGRYALHVTAAAAAAAAAVLLPFLCAEAKVDAGLAARATSGAVSTFSRAMTLRRLHWRNSLLGELLYIVNVSKVSRCGSLLPASSHPRAKPVGYTHSGRGGACKRATVQGSAQHNQRTY